MEAHPNLLIRPANYPRGAPGKGWAIAQTPDGRQLGVINVEGRVFMRNLDDPFRIALELATDLLKQTRCILVDIHCEATSEKNALGAYLDGKVSAVPGTRPPIPAGGARNLPDGTAFITHHGLGGPLASLI